MTPGELIERARGQQARHIAYRLGGGKQIPYGEDCCDEQGSCDCSSFVCWCAGLRKYQNRELWWLHNLNGGWLNTDGIWYDASPSHSTGHFETCEPQVGSIIVYPASWVSDPTRTPKIKVGHIGIVSDVRNGVASKVIHCSSGNYRKHGDAIQETNADVFISKLDTRYVWASSVEEVE